MKTTSLFAKIAGFLMPRTLVGSANVALGSTANAIHAVKPTGDMRAARYTHDEVMRDGKTVRPHFVIDRKLLERNKYAPWGRGIFGGSQ
jgi:hypothetical protein